MGKDFGGGMEKEGNLKCPPPALFFLKSSPRKEQPRVKHLVDCLIYTNPCRVVMGTPLEKGMRHQGTYLIQLLNQVIHPLSVIHHLV